MKEKFIYIKDNPTDKIWIVKRIIGNEIIINFDEHLFSFDKKTIFNFWRDYPNQLSKEQIEIFKKEQSILAKLK